MSEKFPLLPHLINLKRQKHVEQQIALTKAICQSMTKALPKLALSACNNLQGSSGLRLLVLYHTAFCAGYYLSQAATTPEAHGTITGADGCEFRYHSGYLSLKFSFGFSAYLSQHSICLC